MDNHTNKKDSLLRDFYTEEYSFLKKIYAEERKEHAKLYFIDSIKKEGLNQNDKIIKIALELIDKTDGKLTLGDIQRMEKQGYGVVLVNEYYSLTENLKELDENILEKPISKLIQTLDKNYLDQLAEDFSEEGADELVIMGSKEGYIVADIYFSEKSAYVHDLTGDKSSPRYNPASSMAILSPFVSYCKEKGIKEIHMEARESTSDKILKRMKQSYEEREASGEPHPAPFDKIDRIQRGGFAHSLDTKFSQEAKDLLFSYNELSSNLQKIYVDALDVKKSAEEVFSVIDQLNSINKINGVLNDEEIVRSYGELKKEIIDTSDQEGMIGGFFKRVLNIDSKTKKLIEEFLKKINEKIYSFLESHNEYDEDGDVVNPHFTDENYYDYVIYLS